MTSSEGDINVTCQCSRFIADAAHPSHVKDYEENLRRIYNVQWGGMQADTMYCHHMNTKGEHLLLCNKSPDDAQPCMGVMYLDVTDGKKGVRCREARRAGPPHDPCTVRNCAHMRAYGECDFMNAINDMRTT